ncbi:MAG: SpoIIE family protein phosphatase [Methanospirillaceae archaeon]|nr:SpoIIE family protein phosphatase [Methanospirillaceae archaeon]
MHDQIVPAGVELFQLTSVIILVSYFISRTSVYYRVVFQQGSLKDKLLLILFFGALSIYGTMSGFSLFGAQANVRDLGPIIAGLTCGPLVGLGAGIIGVLYRVSLGGITMIPCCLATLLSALIAGFVWWYHKKRFIGTLPAVILVLILELVHVWLVSLLTPDTPGLDEILWTMGTSGMALNCIGMFCFSVVFHNYLLEKKTGEELKRRNTELEIAFQIQESILPSHFPDIQGFQVTAYSKPAREVGGDFYDFIQFEKNECGFLIADVSGKSIPAAIFMGLSCMTIRAAAEWVRHPGKAVSLANNLIYKYVESGMFFSLFYGILDAETGNVRYCNAGHPPPVLVRKDGGIQLLTKTGKIIGFEKDEVYHDETVMLNVGDLLFCYTDGVSESTNKEGDMYGMPRISRVLAEVREQATEEVVSSILSDISQFIGKSPQSDDITVLMIKRTEL